MKSYRFTFAFLALLCLTISQLNAQLESELRNGFMAYYENGTFDNSYIQLLANGGRGTILLFNSNYNQTVQLDTNSEDAGYLGLKNDGGSNIMSLTSLLGHSENGIISLYGGDNGGRLVSLYASPQDVGSLLTEGLESQNVFAGHLSGYTENGYLGVIDSFNMYKAGIYVDQQNNGVVFADIKNFVLDHPNVDDEEIVYASLEGPEAGAYLRGSTKLEAGEIKVLFPDHFRIVGALENYTVQITPLFSDTYGLAVVEKDEFGFVVKELKGGKGSFDFDWEVKTLRKKYKDFQVVRKKSHRKASLKMEGTQVAKYYPVKRPKTKSKE